MSIEFEHITVPSKNLRTSIAFYTSLGMELIEHEETHHAHFENKEHHVIFTTYYNEKKTDYEVKVYFETTNLKSIAARLGKSTVVSPPQTNWEGSELHLSDPDGNRVVLYEKASANSNPPWQQEIDES